MTNFKKYRHKESGEIVEARILFDRNKQPFHSDVKYLHYLETSGIEGAKEFLKNWQEVKENE